MPLTVSLLSTLRAAHRTSCLITFQIAPFLFLLPRGVTPSYSLRTCCPLPVAYGTTAARRYTLPRAHPTLLSPSHGRRFAAYALQTRCGGVLAEQLTRVRDFCS